MSFGNQPADGAGNIMSSAVPDGTTQPYAIAGGPSYVDSGNTKTTVQVYMADGNNVSFGAKADAAATSDTGTFSLLALFKRALQKLTSLVTNTNAFSSLGTDQTGTELRASLYGKNVTAGDTAVATDAGGNVGVNVIGALPAGTNQIGKAQISNSGGAITNANPLQTNLYPGGSVQSVTNPSFVELTDGTNALGTSGNPIRTKPTGTTKQPVTAAAGDIADLAHGQGTMAASVPVVIASDQSKLPTKAASGDFADGSLVTVGTEADAAITNSASSGTLMAFLKGVVSLLSGVLAVKRSAVAVYSLASGAQTTNGNSGDLTVGAYTEIGIDINVTADSGTNETIQFFWDRKGADGVYYPLWQSKTVLSTDSLAEQISTSIGAGMAYNQSLGLTGRLRWVVGGTSPSFTLSANVYGK